MRKTEFANGEYYHIFNRGVDKREVFSSDEDYLRFLLYMRKLNDIRPLGSLRDSMQRKQRSNLCSSYRGSTSVIPLVEIVAYCLNNNHYHFILRQLEERGIEKFMQKLGTGHTMYFNQKYNRSGSLFQGKFKSTHINTNELLLYLSVYVNANHQIHSYPEKNWPYSSYLDYIGKRDGQLCNKEIILGQFGNSCSEYEKYLKINTDYFRDKKELEKYIIE